MLSYVWQGVYGNTKILPWVVESLHHINNTSWRAKQSKHFVVRTFVELIALRAVLFFLSVFFVLWSVCLFSLVCFNRIALPHGMLGRAAQASRGGLWSLVQTAENDGHSRFALTRRASLKRTQGLVRFGRTGSSWRPEALSKNKRLQVYTHCMTICRRASWWAGGQVRRYDWKPLDRIGM